MYNIVGVDIGTTEIKCTLVMINGLKYFWRKSTPKVTTNVNNLEEVTFSPNEIWKIVYNLLEEIYLNFTNENILVSIVSQAPSLCLWDDDGNNIGISYLSYYGDPTINTKEARQHKAIKRIKLANTLFLKYGKGKISGITGYIVYQLSEQLTMDAVTAWELGIESSKDVDIIKEEVGIHRFPNIVAPIQKYEIKNMGFKEGGIIAGTTDSAILPISIFPEFSDYYVYLGTWGSLLKSNILEYRDYGKVYHKGDLHSWIISIDDFIYKVNNSPSFLEIMFDKIAQEVTPYSKIAICGGLVFKMNDTINELISRYLPSQEIVFVTSENIITGACRLGYISIKETYK